MGNITIANWAQKTLNTYNEPNGLHALMADTNYQFDLVNPSDPYSTVNLKNEVAPT